MCDSYPGPDRYGIFGADVDANIMEQENSQYLISAVCGFQILVIKVGYLTL